MHELIHAWMKNGDGFMWITESRFHFNLSSSTITTPSWKALEAEALRQHPTLAHPDPLWQCIRICVSYNDIMWEVFSERGGEPVEFIHPANATNKQFAFHHCEPAYYLRRKDRIAMNTEQYTKGL